MLKKSLATLLSMTVLTQGYSFPVFAQEIPMEELETNSEYSANMEGFMNWVLNNDSLSTQIKNDAKAALKILHDGILDKNTNLNDPEDATSLKNIKASISLLYECNRLRQLPEHNASPLKVGLELMAISQKQLNWSDTGMNHAKAYPVGENLSWGYSDPFKGWYFEEKAIYDKDKGASGVVGHYLNIINPKYTSTGVAHNNNSSYGWAGEADGQVFGFSGGTMTVDEFNKLFTQFEANFPSNTTTNSNDPLNTPSQDIDQSHPDSVSQGKANLYRLYNKNTGEHFYTLSDSERNQLLANHWNDEGEGWTTPKSSAYPIYRLLNPNTGDHHYTVDEEEYLILSFFLGWVGEGIRFYSAHPEDEGAIPLYRLYNPNAKDVGIHHYTTDENERDTLTRLGWQNEGIAWYGLK